MNNAILCRQTGKFMYDSRSLAESVLNRKRNMRKQHRNDNRRFRTKLDTSQITAYRCEFCNKWHIAGKR